MNSRASFASTALALSLSLSLSRAAAAEGGLRLDYVAPPGCPEANALRTAIDRLVTKPATMPVTARVVIVEEGSNAFVSTIAIDGAEERRLEGVSCTEVADATAVVLALALRPDRPVSEEPAPAVAAPAPGPPSTRTEPARDERAAPLTESTLAWSIDVGFAGAAGAMPRPDLGFSLGVGAGSAFWEAALRGVYWLPQRAAIATATNRGGDFRLWTASAEICGVPVRGTSRLGFCIGPEIGRLSGDGFGVDLPEHVATLWTSGVVSAVYHLRLSRHQAVRAELGAAWLAVGHRDFVLGTASVHEPSRFSGRAGLGWEFAF